MRIIIFAFCFAFIGGLCHATEMCARNDTVVIPLDTNVKSIKNTYESNEFVWMVEFENGYRIYGYSTTVSEEEGGKGKSANTGTIFNEFGQRLDELGVNAGLKGVDANGNERKYCWCKMTHSMLSNWVYHGQSGSACTMQCAGAFSTNYYAQTFRKSLFKSVGIK